MQFKPSTRKFILTTHVVSSVGWAGALAVFLAHACATLQATDVRLISALTLGMALMTWAVILPLSLVSLVSGVIQALGSVWGLARHYWVFFKLALTALATGVLLLKIGPIDALSDQAKAMGDAASSLDLRMSLTVHAVGGLVVLLAATALAVYKPKGLLPWAKSGIVQRFPLQRRDGCE